jgi:beta-galactosidase
MYKKRRFTKSITKILLLQISLMIILSTNVFGDEVKMIPDGSRDFVSLNGDWDVLPIKGLTFKYPAPVAGWQKETVPGNSSVLKGSPYAGDTDKILKAGKFDSEKTMAAWFKRNFVLPSKLPKQKRVFLKFNGMAYRSDVWLNGKKLGTSYQCAVPIQYDVTDCIKPGQNELLVGLTGIEGIIDLDNKCLMSPAFGMSAGIWDSVSLCFYPETYIENVFIKTSVNKHMLDVDVTVENRSERALIANPVLTVFDSDGIPQFRVEGEKVAIGAGKTKIVIISHEWKYPILWSLDNSILYNAQIELSDKGNVIDKVNQSFGFREFETRGRDFYLNGEKVVLRRRSMLSTLGRRPTGNPLKGDPRVSPNDVFNSARLHIGFNNKYILDEADKLGLLITPESSWLHISVYPEDKKDVWLPNTLEYYKQWVRTNRNRPSVVMWSLANETFWGRMPENPEMKEIAVQIVDVVRSEDPTRPLDGDAEVTWDGLLDVISIHYPGLPGEVSKKYPNSGFVIPNDLYWLKDKDNHSWRAVFDWDKPLSLGEYWLPGGDPDKWSSYCGEDVYDRVKYSTKDVMGRHSDNESTLIDLLKKATDAYRVQGVACLNPWSGNAEWSMPNVALRALDFYPNYYGGKTVDKKMVLFYGQDFNLNYQRIQCFITVNGNRVWEEIVKVYVKPGEQKIVTVPITPPKVIEQTEAELTMRFMYHAGGGPHEKTRFSETIFIMPEAKVEEETDMICLFSSDKKTIDALKTIGVKTAPLTELNDAALKNKKLIIVGSDVDVPANKSILLGFAEQGGSVIFLQREKWEYIETGFPEQDTKHVATRSWKRTYNHPIVQKFDDDQLSYWRPDNLLGKSNFFKPYSGDFKVIIDAGGNRGLDWTPLCEKELGEGTLIFSQLSLVDRVGIEPAADQMVVNMIDYGLNYKYHEKSTLRVLAKNNDVIMNILDTARIRYTEGVDGDGPILLDSTYIPSGAELTKIKSYVDNGGNLWLHGFTPESVGKISSLLPFEPVLEKIDKRITTAVRLEDSPLMNNLSTRDFFWARGWMGARGGYFYESKSTAPLGMYELKLPTLQSGVRLLDPAILTEIAAGKGTILFDTVDFEHAYDTEGDYVIRIISALASNLGCAIEAPNEDKCEYFAVDISDFANMGYVDEVADDGKGGWLDMGEFDLCFFLINHTGLEGGVGLPVAVPPFPEEYRFCGVPFKLTAPKKNDGKGIIALRGKDRGLKLIDKVEGIPVNHKADKLWFINAANWLPTEKGVTLAKYVMHYTDGSSVEFPIRSWIEIGDWFGVRKIQDAKICWTGNNRVAGKVGLYLTPWTNPHPDKTIKSIDMIGALTTAQVGLVGIAGAEIESVDSISWNMSDYNDGVVKDQTETYELKLRKNNKDGADPIKAVIDDETVLKMDGNIYLNGNLSKIESFDSTAPFSVEVGLSIDELPEAHNRHFGIYQAMNYMKSGFRVTISTKGTVSVTVFPEAGKALNFKGKTELVPGRYYDIKVSFDGKQVKLLVNGKIDLVSKCPMPAPFNGEVSVGRSSGEGTLKGDIQHIKITQP